MRRENWGDLQIQWTGGPVGNRFPYRPDGHLTGLYRRLGIPPCLQYRRTRAGPAFHDALGPDLQEYLEWLKEEALRPVRWMSRQAELLRTPLGEGRLRRALLRALPSAMLLTALVQPRPAQAGPPIAAGNEFQVNTYFTNDQFYASVATDADGDFVVAWHGSGSGDPDGGVFAQRFTSDGNPVGTEFRVNTYTTSAQVFPSVAMDADGDFVVAWQSWLQDGNNYGVFARVYAGDGTPVTGELQVNTYTNYTQNEPSVAMDEDGNFVVAWVDGLADGYTNGIFARRYDSTGTALDPTEFQVNTYTTGYQNSPSVAADADGDFVIAWEGAGQDGSGYGIFAQRYTSDGNPAGSEFQVNTQYVLAQRHPDVAMDADGDFVIAWEDYYYDGSQLGIFARRYDSSGAALDTTEFQVNTYTTSDQRRPSVAMDATGDFAIAWHSYGQDGSTWGVFARRYDGDGTATGVDFAINTYWTSGQAYPAVAMDADGDFVVAWQSLGQDGSTYGVFAQRFNREVSDEFLVNDYTGSQYNAEMAMDADGDFVIIWEDDGPGDNQGVFGQRYSSDGTPIGSEFLVNTYTTGGQRWPSVAMDADGDFVVAWYGSGPGDYYGVFARRYDSGGSAQDASEFLVHVFDTGPQKFPSVAMDAAGNFVVAYQDSTQDGNGYGVFARRFNSSGSPLDTSEFQVNTYTTGSQRWPDVAMDADGDFVVAWHGMGPTDSAGVFARRYNSSGVGQEVTEFLVNTYTTSDQQYPSVAMDSDGDFVVAWQSYLQDGSTMGVFAQRYSSDGAPAGSEFPVNTYVTLQQEGPSVAMDADGDFVIAWESWGQDGSLNGVFARRYTRIGTAVGSEFRVHALTGNSQRNPSAAMDDAGDFGVAWDSQTGTEWSVHARLYDRLKRAFLPLVMRNY